MTRPTLNALHAFEAAGRLGGFAAAAEELCVTPAAVAQRVRALETVLGRVLMVREGRGLVLTDDGRRLLGGLSVGFSTIAASLAALEDVEDGRVSVSVLPSFATLWLLPRLERLREALPEVTLRLEATARRSDLGREGLDLAIRYDAPPTGTDVLLCDRLVVVASPTAARDGAIEPMVEWLERSGLIHDEWAGRPDGWPTWRDWFARTGMTPPAASGTRVSQSALAVQAAMAGQGLALGHHVLVADALRAGALIEPFEGTPLDVRLELPFAYRLVRGPRSHRAAQRFEEWLRAECASFEGASV